MIAAVTLMAALILTALAILAAQNENHDDESLTTFFLSVARWLSIIIIIAIPLWYLLTWIVSLNNF